MTDGPEAGSERETVRRLVVIEYDGTDLHGWQRQDGQRTVQGCIEDALADLVGHAVAVHGAGRTDAGVHALGQTAHFDLRFDQSDERLVGALNHRLAEDIRILEVHRTDPDRHARYGARGKHYRYRLLNRSSPSPLRRRVTWWIRQPLNVAAMERAARVLVGEHDFSAFHDGPRRDDPVRSIRTLDVRRVDDEVRIDVVGSGFLYHMVRVLTGALVAVGRGNRDEAWVTDLLRTGSRDAAAITAPAHGLVLVQVIYDV